MNNININVINTKEKKVTLTKLLLHLLMSKLIIRNMNIYNFIKFFGLIDLRKNINK